jgi:Flp pilus assembly protein TadB
MSSMSVLVAPCAAACVIALGVRFRPPRPPRSDEVHAAAPRSTVDGALHVLEDIERDLRTGSALHGATCEALRRRPATLSDLRRALGAGATLSCALDSAETRDGAELLVLQTLRTCERTGGRMGSAVERAVLVLRERRAWERERHVHAAQARLSATVLTLVPLVFAAWGVVTSERVRDAYAHSPVCAIAAGAGLALNALGWLWMRRLVRGMSS